MPYINTTTNISISKEQELKIKSRYSEAVSLIGKSEAYLMLGFNPNIGISPSQIYVKYEPTEYWGWNGRNF